MEGLLQVGYVIGVVFVCWFAWNQTDEHTFCWHLGTAAGAIFWPIQLLGIVIKSVRGR